MAYLRCLVRYDYLRDINPRLFSHSPVAPTGQLGHSSAVAKLDPTSPVANVTFFDRSEANGASSAPASLPSSPRISSEAAFLVSSLDFSSEIDFFSSSEPRFLVSQLDLSSEVDLLCEFAFVNFELSTHVLVGTSNPVRHLFVGAVPVHSSR